LQKEAPADDHQDQLLGAAKANGFRAVTLPPEQIPLELLLQILRSDR
jgi:hypothetical protein